MSQSFLVRETRQWRIPRFLGSELRETPKAEVLEEWGLIEPVIQRRWVLVHTGRVIIVPFYQPDMISEVHSESQGHYICGCIRIVAWNPHVVCRYQGHQLKTGGQQWLPISISESWLTFGLLVCDEFHCTTYSIWTEKRFFLPAYSPSPSSSFHSFKSQPTYLCAYISDLQKPLFHGSCYSILDLTSQGG
jgi:hypothetical protein